MELIMKRDAWGSRLGFIFAVAGSAIGLANIWRFPYVVGNHGGAAFIFVYLICLLAIGIPVFTAEILIGKRSQLDPSGAFRRLGRSAAWGWAGKLTILTGFVVSSFYSAVAGWILGYLLEALKGNLTTIQNKQAAIDHYLSLVLNPIWGVGFHGVFICVCVFVLYFGVRHGIERWNKFFMPILFIILTILVVKGFFMPNSMESLKFLLQPDFSKITPAVFLIALGQSFFTLSVGQGTLVTYGSYLPRRENILKSTLPVVAMDTLVSIFSAFAVFTIVFAVDMRPDSGPALIFHTLPLVFSQIPGGYMMSILFFLLVFLAAMTSEISALEPAIAYLVDERKWLRRHAVITCGLGAFLLGVPSALSTSLLKDVSVLGFPTFLDAIMFICSELLIPIGGFAAVMLAGWVWGSRNAIREIGEGQEKKKWLNRYFSFCFKYLSPILIIIVFLSALFS
ncbi:putative sodium-dependent transporter YocR [Chlamydiales bacterium STE3]|nr:putative sodium-dependent transporter YocR [Chlamydiales bacterium STE3]